MPLTLKQCPLAFSSRTPAAWVVVVLALSYSARSSQAGVIVGDEQSIGAMASANVQSSLPQNSGENGDNKQTSNQLLNAFGAPSDANTGGGMASPPATGTSTIPVAYLATTLAPQPLLVVWLAGGQCPALPALLPSGLFRPPRC